MITKFMPHIDQSPTPINQSSNHDALLRKLVDEQRKAITRMQNHNSNVAEDQTFGLPVIDYDFDASPDVVRLRRLAEDHKIHVLAAKAGEFELGMKNYA